MHMNNNRHSPLTTTNNNIATAPEVPSTNMNSYYDPRNYPSPTAPGQQQQQVYMPNEMNSVATAVAAAAAANSSLPPLSHLLPTNTGNNKITGTPDTNNATGSNTNTADYLSRQKAAAVSNTTMAEHHQQQRSASISQQQQRSASISYSPSTNTTTTTTPITATATVPSQPLHYRKSIDYSRVTMYPPPSSSDRRFIPTGGGGGGGNVDEYYILQQQQQQQNYASSVPNTMIPSSNGATDISVYSISPSHHQTYNTSTARMHHPHSNYHLPSPPTSVIDGVLVANHPHHLYHNNQHVVNGGITNNSQKVFSFVPLPGLNQKKRPRRKFHEVERLYQCNYQDCTKSYGTLNHLNAHVSMQRHGPKRQPSEFKELRKMWRKQKRDNKQRSGSRSTTHSTEDEEIAQQQQDLQNAAAVMMNNGNSTTTTHNNNNTSILSHSNGTLLSHQHHDYMPTSTYMHHPPHHLMSHHPPPPPPPVNTTGLWRPHHHQHPYQHHQQTAAAVADFMPPPGY